jgi:3-dehydroquinate dehydratase type I
MASVDAVIEALRDTEFAEIRLDLIRPRGEDLPRIFTSKRKLIATCRPGPYDDSARLELLSQAIELGASFVDIEDDCDTAFRTSIVQRANRRGCKVIFSHHDYDRTTGRADLQSIIQWSLNHGADLVKIACRVNEPRDNAVLLGLFDNPDWQQRLLVVGMGEHGAVSRILAPLLGSPFTYAALGDGLETAPGQLTRDELLSVWTKLRIVK